MNKYIKLVRNDPIKFGLASGFEDLTEVHNKWIKSFLFEEEDQTLLAHRWQL